MAQAMLTTAVRERGIEAHVASAGLIPGGQALPIETQDTLRAFGFNGPGIERFRSTQITDGLVSGADLVIGLAREHVREVVVRTPEAWERSFTLKELVRRGGVIGPRPTSEDLPSWLYRAGFERTRADLLGESIEDDVIDPAGGVASGFDRTAAEIQALCRSLGVLLWA
jgi:protein-tyrosine phosphatase